MHKIYVLAEPFGSLHLLKGTSRSTAMGTTPFSVKTEI
jgi:hypothetical protein